MSDQPVISAWSAISPWGHRASDFARGLRSGRRTATEVTGPRWDVPVRQACLVPDFEIAAVLGKKGTRSMDRATAMAVAAVGHLLDGETAQRLSGIGDGTGLALGTSTGSVQSTMDFTRESLVSQRPYLVDPARFPNTVMNCAAGQSAIRHRLRGPNATIAAGRATGLLALQYALRLQRAGRAEALLCGAVEEFSPARAWLAWHSRPDGAEPPVLGEGAAIWLLERAATAAANGRPAIAEVAGLEFGFCADGQEIRGVLAECVHRLLDRTGTRPDQVLTVAESGAPGADGAAERAALDDVLGSARPDSVTCADSIGDTYAAAAAFQVAAVLAIAQGSEPECSEPERSEPERSEPAFGRHGPERSSPVTGRLALVTSVEAGGVAGAALLRLC